MPSWPDGRHYKSAPGAPDLISAFKADSIPHVPQGVVDLIQARKQKGNKATAAATEPAASAKAVTRSPRWKVAAPSWLQQRRRTQRDAERPCLPARPHGRAWLDRAGRGRGRADRGLVGKRLHRGRRCGRGRGNAAIRHRCRHEMPARGSARPGRSKPADSKKSRRPYPPRRSRRCTAFSANGSARSTTLDALHAALAAAASERLTGDPLWLLVDLRPGQRQDRDRAGAGRRRRPCHQHDRLRRRAALGTAAQERTKNATGGLLRKIGDRGVLVIKDVTSILSADRNMRASVLAAFREIYDGRWERNVGTDGGQTLTWTGRIVIVGAVTTAWDAAHAVVAAMGDRFVTDPRRLPAPGAAKSGTRAIRNTGGEIAMRQELAAAVGGIIGTCQHRRATSSPTPRSSNLVNAADIVTLARTAVERDYQGDVIDAHAPEMPTRFAKQLAQMIRGAVAIGMTPRSRHAAGASAAPATASRRCGATSCSILPPIPGPAPTTCASGSPALRRSGGKWKPCTCCACCIATRKSSSTATRSSTIWRYSLAPDFDRNTLLDMTRASPQQTITRNVSEYMFGGLLKEKKTGSGRRASFVPTHISGDTYYSRRLGCGTTAPAGGSRPRFFCSDELY